MAEFPEAKGYLVDLDGTLISGGALPGARELVAALGERMVVVSNDSEHVPAQLSRMLAGWDLRVPPERIVLAGTATVDLVARERPGGRVLLLAGPALSAHARARGLRLVTERPDLVVVARDRRFTYARLERACRALAEGAGLVAANPDLVHPGPHGPVPETGALLSAILACAGPVPCRIVGKPEPALFERALAVLGIAAADAVMIGDNPQTDGAGAKRLGIRYVDAGGGLPQRTAAGGGRARPAALSG
jgi:HAD superfamily hydrolase (TIGR01450 family)